jgi:predicted transglutaminase-like cysteine proteinase
VIQKTHAEVLRHFVWAPDSETFGVPEHWTSHADTVEKGETFRDDCDGFALTCAELLLRRGVPRASVRIALCWTETGEYHAVCIADDLLLDNRQRWTVPWTAARYRWDKSMSMDEPGIWRGFSV